MTDLQENRGLILIVDDIPKNIQLLGKTLRDEGYNIAVAMNGEQALTSVSKFNPDLILLDIMMPGMDGFEVCQKLKNNEDLKEIPVIFLTAKVEQESINKGLELGGADYITKPFNTRELLSRVATHLQLKRSKDLIHEKNERLEKMSQTRDRIYSVIGHDLNSPVNSIIGLSDLSLMDLEDNSETEKLNANIRMIKQSAVYLRNLLGDLLTWARSQSGEFELRLEPVSPHHIIREIINLFKPTADQKNILLNLNTNNDQTVTADEKVVATIARNFISNAIKYSQQGSSVDINIDFNNEWWQISVTDEGTGMSEKVQQRLFSKENHPRNKGTSNEMGTGMGLLICQELAERHNGEISVESELNKGSTFTLKLPFVQS